MAKCHILWDCSCEIICSHNEFVIYLIDENISGNLRKANRNETSRNLKSGKKQLYKEAV